MKPLCLSAAIAISCLASSLSYAQNATLTRDAELKSQPFTDAATITSLRKKAAVSIVGSKGGWTQVSDGQGQTGWVRLLDVRPDSQGGSATGFLNSLASIGNVARTGTTGATATTGTKGISIDELKRAVPNPKERKRMDQYLANNKSANAHARANKLQAQHVEWLKPADATPVHAVAAPTGNRQGIAPTGSIRVKAR